MVVTAKARTMTPNYDSMTPNFLLSVLLPKQLQKVILELNII